MAKKLQGISYELRARGIHLSQGVDPVKRRNAMALEDAERIDFITTSDDGKVNLVIMDGGVTADPEDRFAKLVAKLRTYLRYVRSEEFKEEFPGFCENDVRILVKCSVPPTDRMGGVTRVSPKGHPEAGIPVVFEVFSATDDETETSEL